MKVLFAVWELDPFLKVGGLGDVARSLPGALKGLGVDIRVVIPFYKALKLGRNKKICVKRVNVKYAEKNEKAEIFQVTHPVSQVPVYLIKNDKYLTIPNFPDTFAFFNKAIVASFGIDKIWQPDIIHCNDLHTALIPLLLRQMKSPIKTILTIHNLSHQGKTSLDLLKKIGLEEKRCRVVNWEIKANQLNFLLEGIIHADIVTTVSPTYAREIMKEEYGDGLEEVLRGKEGRVFGILNGIDSNWRQLMQARHVKYPYRPPEDSDWEKSKRKNKIFLQKKLGLKTGASIPLFCFIGRFDPKQKGIDILHKSLRQESLFKYQFVILGTGNVDWEERFQWLDKFYPRQISCQFKFDETLAHQMYAASDFILVPSKFEPCGLVQMIAMYFGTLPIAYRTGGLIDSIKDGYNGFLFNRYSSKSLIRGIEKALGIWQHKRPEYKKMVENAFATDFSWDKSAKEYIQLYDKLDSGVL